MALPLPGSSATNRAAKRTPTTAALLLTLGAAGALLYGLSTYRVLRKG
jgi:hypothetical protein